MSHVAAPLTHPVCVSHVNARTAVPWNPARQPMEHCAPAAPAPATVSVELVAWCGQGERSLSLYGLAGSAQPNIPLQVVAICTELAGRRLAGILLAHVARAHWMVPRHTPVAWHVKLTAAPPVLSAYPLVHVTAHGSPSNLDTGITGSKP